jgi:hypothetical protein
MEDPNQAASQAAGRQDRALQEKYRAKIQSGALTGLVERNTKFDVEYEGKDAKGQLVRPFEPGYGDSRPLPDKMIGEDISQAVARSMGRNLPHSGAGDGKHIFHYEFSEEKLANMRELSCKSQAPPPAVNVSKKSIRKAREQQRRLEEQWEVGLTGGSYGMHTRHVITEPPSPGKKSIHSTLGKESPIMQSSHMLGLTPEAGPMPVVDYDLGKTTDFKPIDEEGKFDRSTSWCRSPSGKQKPPPEVLDAKMRLRGDAASKLMESKVHVAQGAKAMLDRTGPNIASGPIPRDGFTTDAYEEYTKKKLAMMGYTDIRGEHTARPDEIANGIDHLDQLEHLTANANDAKYSAGFTGNTALLTGGAKVNVGKGARAK